MSVCQTDNCSIAKAVKEHLLQHDEPANFLSTLEDMFRDSVTGLTFEGADAGRRSTLYSHYCQLREFLNAIR